MAQEKFNHREHWQQAAALIADSIHKQEEYLSQKNYQAFFRNNSTVLSGRVGNLYDVHLPCNFKCELYWLQAQAHEELGAFTEAIKSLDSLLISARNCSYQKSGQAFCKRGELRYVYLNDKTGSCEDLKNCGYHYKQPLPVDLKKSECGFTQKSLNKLFARVNRDIEYGDKELTFKSGYVHQRASGLELGMFYSRGLDLASGLLGIPSHGPAVGAAIMGYRGTTFIAPKISYEYHTIVFGGRADLSYYLVNGRQDLRFTPQIGPSLSPYLNLNFGYSFSLIGEKPDYLHPFKVSIYLNIPKISKIGG